MTPISIVSAGSEGAAVAALTTAPIGGTFIKPEAGQRVYWTKVSTNTKVRIGHIAKKSGAYPIPCALQNRSIANTIVQLQSRAAA
jgi:hypothetical protein